METSPTLIDKAGNFICYLREVNYKCPTKSHYMYYKNTPYRLIGAVYNQNIIYTVEEVKE